MDAKQSTLDRRGLSAQQAEQGRQAHPVWLLKAPAQKGSFKPHCIAQFTEELPSRAKAGKAPVELPSLPQYCLPYGADRTPMSKALLTY